MSANHVTPPWPQLETSRKAIVVVDVVESVRLMQAHEADVIDRWRRFVNEIQVQVLPAHGGRLVKSLGDGLLLEFGTVHQAVASSRDIQQRIRPYNAGRSADAAMHLRIGGHIADVVVDLLDIYGAGVNVAARLASLAGPGQIVMSADARDCLLPGIDADIEDMGECYVKHLSDPLRAFRIAAPDQGTVPVPPRAPHSALAPLVAVLPFDGGDPRENMLGALAADRAISVLSRSRTIDVVSRLSTAPLQGRQLPAAQLHQALRAQYVLSGRIIQHGGGLVITAELAELAGARVLWQERLSCEEADLLGEESELGRTLAQQVIATLMTEGVLRARTLPLHSLDGYALLVGGIALMNRLSRRDFERARELFETLAERLPRHPAPRAWLAQWHVLARQQGWTADAADSARRAGELTRRALDLDPDDSLALTMDGLVQVHFHKELSIGEQRYRQALAVNPNESLTWLLKGMLHGFRGEGDEALHDTQRALKLTPLDPMRYYYESLAASAATSAGRYELAIDLARSSLKSNATHTSTLRALAISQSMLGRLADAHATVERLLALEPGFNLRGFMARSPAQAYDISQRFAQALRDAGVPE